MVTIHLAGDSTVAPGPLDDSGVAGWGAALPAHVAEPVHNVAIGGATTASFVAEGRWQQVLDAVAPEDLVLIQFGHNDQKDPALAADGGYAEHLARFVAQVRERGGRPVLLTSLERRLFDDDGALRVSHGPYPAPVRATGARLEVPVIELNAWSRWLYTWLGEEASWALFGHAHPDTGAPDTTHLGAYGARTVAAFVAESLRAIRGLDDHHAALGAWGVQP